MLTGALSDTVGQIAVLYLFAAAGYIFSRVRLLKRDAPGVISVLLARFFLPCMLAYTIPSGFSITRLNEYFIYLACGTAAVAAVWFPAKLIAGALADSSGTGGILTYAMIFPNISYLGYPLAKAVLPELYLPLVIFGLPFTVAANTLGLKLFACGSGKIGISRIVSAPVIGVALGILLSLLPFKIPAVAEGFLGAASGCTGPLAMLLTGIVLERGRRSENKSGGAGRRLPAIMAVSAVRLIAAPLLLTAAAFAVCRIAGITAEPAMVTAAAVCLPCGMNMIFMPEADGASGNVGAYCMLVTNTAGIITVPVIYTAISAILANTDKITR